MNLDENCSNKLSPYDQGVEACSYCRTEESNPYIEYSEDWYEFRSGFRYAYAFGD